jgi:hypothetical protein
MCGKKRFNVDSAVSDQFPDFQETWAATFTAAAAEIRNCEAVDFLDLAFGEHFLGIHSSKYLVATFGAACGAY